MTRTGTRADVEFDIAVVGAGPAGLSAAVAAAEAGRSVALIDAGEQPGGQYWRHPDEAAPRGDESLGHHDWPTFTDLRARLRRLVAAGRIAHLPRRQVWFVERSKLVEGSTLVEHSASMHTLHLTSPYGAVAGDPPAERGRAAANARRAVTASALILAPGGYDRQLPIPGWDLPGVMAAGGVQALLKGHRTLAGRRVIVGGTGPFLLPVATGLAAAGAQVVAVCESASIAGWLRHARAAAAVPAKAGEALEYATTFARYRIPYRQQTAITAIHGDDAVRSVTLSRLDRQGRIRRPLKELEVDLVALGWGFTPSLELVTATGADTRKDVDDSLVAVVDDHQRASVPGVYVAGEATGIGGAALAVAEGELAGRAAAADLARRAEAQRGLPAAGAPEAFAINALQQRISRYRRFAAAMHAAHPVPAYWHDWLRPDTLVCRCEEVTVGQVRTARDELGAGDARTMKLLTRTGMGWCQGRVCGYATAKLAAAHDRRPLTAADLRSTAKRSLAAPVSLAELAGAPDDA